LVKRTLDQATITNGALDDRHLAHRAAHHDGHALADVGAGIVPELVARFVGESEIHLFLPGVRIHTRLSGAEIAAGHDGGTLDHVIRSATRAAQIAREGQNLVIGR
jgi:hypothetical protein